MWIPKSKALSLIHIYLGQMIVYLRDIADYAVVKAMYDQRFPHTPKVFVHAPVCRPGWLIAVSYTHLIPIIY